MAERSAGVGEIIHKNSDAALNVADKYHGSDCVNLFTFFVNQGKVDIQLIGNRGNPKMVNDFEARTKFL